MTSYKNYQLLKIINTDKNKFWYRLVQVIMQIIIHISLSQIII